MLLVCTDWHPLDTWQERASYCGYYSLPNAVAPRTEEPAPVWMTPNLPDNRRVLALYQPMSIHRYIVVQLASPMTMFPFHVQHMLDIGRPADELRLQDMGKGDFKSVKPTQLIVSIFCQFWTMAGKVSVRCSRARKNKPSKCLPRDHFRDEVVGV